MSDAAAGRALGISHDSVWRARKALGIPRDWRARKAPSSQLYINRRGPRPIAASIDDVLRLEEVRSLSNRNAAEVLDTSVGNVQRMREKLGLSAPGTRMEGPALQMD